MSKVLIAPATLANVQDAPFLTALRGAGFELAYPSIQAQLTEADLLRELVGVRASLAGSEPYTARVLDAFPELRIIARAGVGYDAVDVQAATARGVAVTFTPGTNHDAVAEHTFALMLALAKDVVPQHLGTCALKWPRRSNLPLRGRTLGIAGLGRIGKAVALRGQAFGMPLLAYEPFPDHAFAAQVGLTYVSFEELLERSDYLSLHLPATPQSRHLIQRATLARMKPTAFLINTARGSLVRESDLLEALQTGRLAGAGLDVFEDEPPADSELFRMPNVVTSPHTAGVDTQSLSDMALSAAQAIVSLSRGEWPAEKIVNPEARTLFRW